ncbi:MAG: 2Fe-2S iron-sulfur cluster-binding protein [Acidobacteriota bacterium]
MSNRLLQFVSVSLLALTITVSALAQISPEEHAAHHPKQGQPEARGGTPGGASGPPKGGPPDGMGGEKGGMMGQMGGMMEKMGAPKPKELYPSLMDLPDLPPDKRAEIERLAHERMKAGTTMMATALERLSGAASRDDYAAMQEATARMREALAQFESGLAAHRALAEGKAPRNVALQWFKRDMSLLPPSGEEPGQGLFGLPVRWFHYFVIAVLASFTGAMAWMYFHKMRRAETLLGHLASGSAAAPAATFAAAAPVAGQAGTEVSSGSGIASASVAPRDALVVAPATVEPATALPRAVSPGKWSGRLRLSKIFQETPEVKTFRMVNPDGGPWAFTYLAGQYLTLTVAPEGKPVKRSYTIASSPTERDYLEITVKREEFGLVSRYLHDRVQEGDELNVTAPSGYFTFTGQEAESVVLIAGGVGITPMMSAIRNLTDHGWPGDMFLLFCCRTSRDFIFREELEYLQRRHTNLHIFATMTRAEGDVWIGLKGRFTKELIALAVPEITARRVHLCGPVPMMDAVKQMLNELGVPKEQIKTENFGTAKRTPQAAATPAEVKAVTAAATVTFARSGKSAALPPDQTILDVADSVGVEIDNSCRSGSCGSCKVKLLSGTVTMECEDALEPNDKAQNIILACQAKSTSNVAVEA